MGVTGGQPLGRTFLEPWSWQKQEPQRKVPVAHVNLDGVPSHPGPLKVSGIHLPTLDQWWGWWQWPHKGNAGCMAPQAPDLRSSSPDVALTLETALAEQFTENEIWCQYGNRRGDWDTGGM